MKQIILYLALVSISLPALAQDKPDTSAILNLPGDNLDLYATLDLFQKSKTIEGFEKSLNDKDTKINNLDLDLDKKVDFIKVTTQKEKDSYRFILQIDVSKTETQDVAVILLDKDKNGKISMQIVGDPELYGKDYVIEPKGNSAVTANPGYTGTEPVKDVPASTTTTVVVQQSPVVQYVYSPAYVPYAPPYYYGYYPPWFGFMTVMAVGIYRSNHWYGYGGYHGGHYHGGNTVIINNRNSINHYNNTRNTSNTVNNNMAKGNYGNRTNTGNRGGASASTRPSTGTGNRGGANASTRPSAGTSNLGNSPSNRASASPSTRQSSPSMSNRSSSPSPSTRSSGSYGGGGGRSMNSGGGGFRGGGGGGGRRR